jgi:hypothetical protein
VPTNIRHGQLDLGLPHNCSTPLKPRLFGFLDHLFPRCFFPGDVPLIATSLAANDYLTGMISVNNRSITLQLDEEVRYG